MTVLVLPGYFDRDGVTSSVLAEGKQLAGQGVRLVVVVPRNPFARGNAVARLRALGIRHYYALTHSRVLNLFFPLNVWSLRRIIRREKVDLLHVHHGRALALAVTLSRLQRIPLVYTIHGVGRRELPRAFRNFLFRRVCRVLAVSEECAAFFASRVRYPAAQVILRRNAVDFSRYASRAECGAGSCRLLYLSRLDRDKRRAVDALLAAAPLILGRWPHASIRILGAGWQQERIRRRAQRINAALGRRAILVEGWAADPALPMAQADAVLGAGRCVIEAIAAGRSALVLGNERIGGWVTADNFSLMQAANFSGRHAADLASGENLFRELARGLPGPDENARVRARAAADHDAAMLAAEARRVYLQARHAAGRDARGGRSQDQPSAS